MSVHPESHRAVDRARHEDLLRRARSGELVSAIAESRRVDRRSRIVLLRERRWPADAWTAPRQAPA